ncbi:MAG: PPC domain-containing protein [Planctomycetota bacterium]|nr:PPC domain-containing protein [Planctomycetota bacterium]MDA1213842.1 PPC domain-containing protein [Planctomycetota bacterium]
MQRRPYHIPNDATAALRARMLMTVVVWVFLTPFVVRAEWPAPVLNSVFPPGGSRGTTVSVVVQGTTLEGLSALRFTTSSGISAAKTGDNQFEVTIPADTSPGSYDLRVVCTHGVSASRPFVVSRLQETIESEPNNEPTTSMNVSLDSVVNGKINPHGDVDVFTFEAQAGQRVVIECFAERIDSPLHGVLELYDASGKKLASNRGYSGVDPLLDVIVPDDGVYTIQLFDLTYTGGEDRFYRLDIDTKPRVAFAFPPVVQRGESAQVTLFGRNLNMADPTTVATNDDVVALENGTVATPVASSSSSEKHQIDFDQVTVEIETLESRRFDTIRQSPAQLAGEVLAYHYPGAQEPIAVGLTDIPVVVETTENHSPALAQVVSFPCEIAGRLTQGSEQDWYGIDMERGEVLWIEALGERIGSPVDLDVVLLDASGTKEILHLGDETDHQGKPGFPANHLDPAGRWVAPDTGRYLIIVRNLIGDSRDDARRIYRLSLRREEPAFQAVAQGRLPEQMSGFTLQRGERDMLDILIERRRGETGAIRIAVENLPTGVECPPIWIGPGSERAPLIVTCTRETPPYSGELQLFAENANGTSRDVRGIMLVRPGMRIPERRVTDEIALATTAADFPIALTATMEPVGFIGEIEYRNGDPIVYQGAVIDLLITAERRLVDPAPISLSAVGLPDTVENQYAVIAAEKRQGWLSFQLPLNLPTGPYTIAIQGTTEIPNGAITPGKEGKTSVTCFTNPISFVVEESKIEVDIDRFAPQKIARGEIIQLHYSAKCRHGFQGKIHTELVAPGGVIGVRGRGVTFTSGTETGTIQIIATENAPLGKQPFLRLDAVGTVEDRPVYRGGHFLELEITE